MIAARPTVALARRSVRAVARQPEMIVPSLFFPLLFAALNTAAFERATNLPGFPKVDSFLDFVLASTIVQGVLFGATSGGSGMALDIQGGFFDRLLTSPVPRSAIVLGRLAGTGVLGAAQAAAFTAVLMAFGADVKSGPLGVLAIVVVGAVLAVGIGSFAVALALRTGSQEAVQAFFPVFFIALFLSSAFFPRQLMSGWFAAVATANPISYMIESLRHLVIAGLDAGHVARALAIAAAVTAAGMWLSAGALQRRIRTP